MMKQWRELKAQAPSHLLFFRLGDFYELFEDDAVTAAPVMGVTLTRRNQKGSSAEETPLCGIPILQFENYINRLLDRGFRVALAEQMENPEEAKGIVRREIVQFFSPGIRLLENEERPHYAAVATGRLEGAWSVAASDVATGHILVESGQGRDSFQELIERLPIQDLRYSEATFFRGPLPLRISFSESLFLLNEREALELCLKGLHLASNKDLPTDSKMEIQALGTLFQILIAYHPKRNLKFLQPRLTPDSVWLPASTRKNLHLFEPENASLFSAIDRTVTSMGKRALKGYLSHPLRNARTLEERRRLIEHFKKDRKGRAFFRSSLRSTIDLYRWLRKRRSPYGLMQLSQSLIRVQEAAAAVWEVPQCSSKATYLKATESLSHLRERLQKTLQSSEEETGWIQAGVNTTLDELRELEKNSNQILLQLEERLRKETGISTLKIKFHQVFGYVIEVTASHREKVPANLKRVQTLANAERFKSEELESLEDKLLSVGKRIREAEASEIEDLYQKVDSSEALLLELAESLSDLDALQSLAQASDDHSWSTPSTLQLENQSLLKIEKGVHPLIEKNFIPLSLDLDSKRTQSILLTGPNMAGKSTVLRLAATVALLHQIGSDVPAESATLSIFDRIACRMGAEDDPTAGKSTFFVEMREVATMIEGASNKSLLLFDEIGRGTSTFDGMSLAWAITEEVHALGALSLIATHYLELSDLERTLGRLKNFHLGIVEENGELYFTRQLLRGPASRSYGLHVAKLASMKNSILKRAEEKLKEFEKAQGTKSLRGLEGLPLFRARATLNEEEGENGNAVPQKILATEDLAQV